MSPTAVPPSPQEIHRKLSVHSVTRPKIALGHVSGTESDSDSVLTPDVSTALTGHSAFANPSSQPPLSSIAERSPDCGVDTDEEDAAGGWRTPDARRQKGDGDSVIKSGYLSKKGMRRRTWKKRWFVLRPAHLAYYKSNAEYQTLKILDLADIHSCTPVNLKGHDNSFCLVSPNRTFYFQASSPDDMKSWVAVIEETRQTLLATSTQTSASTPIPIPTGRPSSLRTPALTLSSSPGNLHAITSSDSEDGGPSTGQRGYYSGSAPSPTALNFAPSPTKPSSAVPTANASKIIVSGYLMKCGSKRRNWRKRWFVLTSEKLVYSGSHMDTKHHKSFPFSEILDALEFDIPSRHAYVHSATASSPPTSGFVSEGEEAGSHSFKIVTTKRTLLLCAPNEEDEIRWLGAIRALIARRSESGMVPGKTPKLTAPGGASGSSQRSQEDNGVGGGSASPNVPSGMPAVATASSNVVGTPLPSGSGGLKGKPRRMSTGGGGGAGGGSSGITEEAR
ncbi:PH domain-containing protein [Coprinopsis sp. MPI-PUGE-AT-0042]|nr:PH domain-containing protein [Coprinopsis sp. MPI-PUGE-AT-0042]